MSAPISNSPTRITIRPDREAMEVARFPKSDPRRVGERYQFGPHGTTATAGFFGEDGAGLRDVVDAVNPLCHIPFVSSLYEEATGSKISAASKLVGGMLLGGPVGFIAALANVVFEQETGHSAGGAVLAALTGSGGEAPAAQLAAAPAPAAMVAQAELPAAPIAVAAADPLAVRVPDAADDAVLSLFGGPDMRSAHDSYRKAQFTPYLTDVGTSLVM